MGHVRETIGRLRRLHAWAARIFLRPASVTLVSRPAEVGIARPGERTG